MKSVYVKWKPPRDNYVVVWGGKGSDSYIVCMLFEGWIHSIHVLGSTTWLAWDLEWPEVEVKAKDECESVVNCNMWLLCCGSHEDTSESVYSYQRNHKECGIKLNLIKHMKWKSHTPSLCNSHIKITFYSISNE